MIDRQTSRPLFIPRSVQLESGFKTACIIISIVTVIVTIIGYLRNGIGLIILMDATDRREGASERSEEMIDTVKLYLESDEYFVRENADLIIVPPDIDNSTGNNRYGYRLFNNGKGSHIGKKAFYNNPDNGLSVTIKPFSPNGGRYYNPIYKVYCYVQFSIPRIIFGDNFSPADEGEVNQAFDIVFKELKSIGLIGDFIKSRFSRIDIFKNADFDFPVQSYYPIFETLKGKRMRNNEGINGEYHRWGNTAHVYCCYDKNVERMYRGRQAVQGNIIRFEYRLMKHSKVKTVTGYDTVEDLLNNYKMTPQCYHAAFSELLKYDPKEFELMAADDDIKNIWLKFKEMGRPHWFSDALEYVGWRDMKNKYGTDTLKNKAIEVAGNRMAGSRVAAKIDAINRQMLMSNIEGKSQKTYAELYQEIQEKVLDGKVNRCKSA